MPREIPKPWDAFLKDLDRSLGEPVELHCLGGFVLTMLYGLKRPTADVDVLARSGPESTSTHLQGLAPRFTRSTASTSNS